MISIIISPPLKLKMKTIKMMKMLLLWSLELLITNNNLALRVLKRFKKLSKLLKKNNSKLLIALKSLPVIMLKFKSIKRMLLKEKDF
jgi:hypothetical protein